MVWPNLSWAPLTDTLYAVPAASGFVGVKVALELVLSNVTFPGTAVPFCVTVNVTELGTTGSLNVTVGVSGSGLLDDPATGVELTTDGGAPFGWTESKITSTA